MANPLKGETSMEIGGVTYTLKVSYNALCEVEKITGKYAPEVMQELQDGSFDAARTLFYASLKSKHPTVTLEQAGDLLQEATLGVAIVHISEALTTAFTPTNDASENPQKQQTETAGT